MTINLATDQPITVTGKNQDNENFPVGSWLIAPHLRPIIHAFYRLARLGDDIADDPLMDPAPKLQRLRRLADILNNQHDAGDDAPEARDLRKILHEKNITTQHGLDLLHAFEQDAVKRRYNNWDELLDYCRFSAAPVGRFVLDVHGESSDTWPANDALCTVLQILNHLQDMADDYRENDRVYLPLDMMAVCGADPAMLSHEKSSPALHQLRQMILDQLAPLITLAGRFPRQIKSPRLRLEVGVIVALAHAMTAKLRKTDPIWERSKLNKYELALACICGMVRAW